MLSCFHLSHPAVDKNGLREDPTLEKSSLHAVCTQLIDMGGVSQDRQGIVSGAVNLAGSVRRANQGNGTSI
jgi:hypothetical protein